MSVVLTQEGKMRVLKVLIGIGTSSTDEVQRHLSTLPQIFGDQIVNVLLFAEIQLPGGTDQEKGAAMMVEPQMVCVEAECETCQGTGVKVSLHEGIAILCRECKGSGKTVLKLSPFSGRKLRQDVRTICHYAGGTGEITYEDFLAGKIPESNQG